MSNPNQIQQGDVCLECVDKLPAGCKVRKRVGGRSIVTEGSQSGNSHYFDDKKAVIYDAPDGTAYVCNESGDQMPMKHTRDHNPVMLAPNRTYRIGGLNEMDHLTGMVNKVVD